MKKENFEIRDIFPNPANKYFTFTFIPGSKTGNNKLKVSIYDTGGSQILQKEYDRLVAYSQYTFKTGRLDNGTYEVVFAMDKKMVKQQINVLK